MRLFGALFNLMLLSMAFGIILLPVIIGIGYIVYKVINKVINKKWSRDDWND